eukprot:1134706_1
MYIWSNVFIMGLFSLAVYAKLSSFNEGIKEELSRITRYELMHFDLSSFKSDNIISFDTFNKHYQLKLTVNPFIIMGQIDHIDTDTDYGSNNLNTSCHYHGTILNIDGPSSVALSMCPGRGIRGSIQLQDDRLEINPSRHYFEGEVRARGDEIHDEHLIYKSSDFNSTGYPKLKYIDLSAIKSQLKGTVHAIMRNTNRRRLRSSNTVDMYILSDPSYTSARGGSSRAQSYCADALNKVTADYRRASWSIGQINFEFSGFTAISSWSGKYRGLKPTATSGSKVDAGDFLIKMQNWIPRNLGTSRYDAFHMVSDTDLEYRNPGNGQVYGPLGGLAPAGTMCGGKVSDNVGISRQFGSSVSGLAHHMAHEIGHNFGMQHDTDAGCPSGYIMGPSGGANGWSSCSRDALKSHCRKKSNCGCLSGSGGGHDNLEGWGYEVEDTECLKREQYSQKICVHNYMEDLKQEYTLSDGSCVNERGVYLHEKKYQLHWEPDAYLSRNGSWVISAFNMSYTALAQCKGEWHGLNERECGKKKWRVRGFDGDQVLMIDDETLAVMDGPCDVSASEQINMWMWIALAGGLVIVLIVVLLVFYNIRRKKRTVTQKMMVPDEEDEEEGEEIEMDVDMEQNTTVMITSTN